MTRSFLQNMSFTILIFPSVVELHHVD